MSVYKIPRKFKAGEFKFTELDSSDECIEPNYDETYGLLTYEAPMYENEVRVYCVPKELMPNALAALYGKNGELEKVTLAEGERVRLIYIRFKDIMKSESGVLKFVKEQADRIAQEIIKRKQTLARLFVEKFYDGEAVDIAAKTATADEMRAVIDEYDGDVTTADNSGNYPSENRLAVDDETLGVMLMCTNGEFRSMLFNKAAETFEERLKSRVLDKTDKTGDFKFISEEYD